MPRRGRGCAIRFRPALANGVLACCCDDDSHSRTVLSSGSSGVMGRAQYCRVPPSRSSAGLPKPLTTRLRTVRPAFGRTVLAGATQCRGAWTASITGRRRPYAKPRRFEARAVATWKSVAQSTALATSQERRLHVRSPGQLCERDTNAAKAGSGRADARGHNLR